MHVWVEKNLIWNSGSEFWVCLYHLFNKFLNTYYVQGNVVSITYLMIPTLWKLMVLEDGNMGRRDSKQKITEIIDFLHVQLVPQKKHRLVLLSRPDLVSALNKDAWKRYHQN